MFCLFFYLMMLSTRWKLNVLSVHWGFPGGTSGKESTCQCRRHKRHGFRPSVWKIPWRRKWQPTPVFLAGNSSILREIPWTEAPGGHKELDTTEHMCACSQEKEAVIPSFVCDNVFNFFKDFLSDIKNWLVIEIFYTFLLRLWTLRIKVCV